MGRSLLPPTESSIIADLRKRVEVLERTSRVPQVTRGGTQASVGQNGDLGSNAEVLNSLLDGQTETDGVDLEVKATNTGRLIVIWGATINCGSLGVSATMRPWFPDLTLAEQPTDAIVYQPQGDVPSTGTNARVLEGLTPGTHRIQARYAKSPGAFVASFTDPWLIALPIA